MGKKCGICGLDIVLSERTTAICLDCLVKELVKQGAIELPIAVMRPWQSRKMKHKNDHIPPQLNEKL